MITRILHISTFQLRAITEKIIFVIESFESSKLLFLILLNFSKLELK